MSTRRLSRLALVATIVLVGIGGFTRGSDSGYGCADRWPLCENGLLGGLLPRAEYHMIIEWTHRWAAATVGLLAVATAVSAWRRHRPVIVIPAIGAVVVIGVQAWVGRLVVKGALDRDLVSLHLAISMTIVALLTIVVVATAPAASRAAWARSRDRAWTLLLAGAAAGSLALLLLGSYVHNLYVDGWPLVRNTLLPDLSNRFVAIHYIHRVVAAAGLVYVVYLAVAATHRRRPEKERLLIYGAASVYVVNVGLGAAHVFTRVNSSALVAVHLVMASLVWTFLIAATAMSTGTDVDADASALDGALSP